jgi:hypothetical protein
LDISPGQVWSLREAPQMTRMRERDRGSFWRFSAARSRRRVSSHFDRQRELRVREAGAGGARARALAVFVVALPGHVHDPIDLGTHGVEGRVVETLAQARAELRLAQGHASLPGAHGGSPSAGRPVSLPCAGHLFNHAGPRHRDGQRPAEKSSPRYPGMD